MAIKGNAYTKTAWAYQERPVASAKLNLWDDRIEAALELAFFLLGMAWGGGDGVIRGAADDDLRVDPTSPVSMAVRVHPGYAFIDRFPFRLTDIVTTAAVTAPSVYPRKDLVQASLADWTVSVKTGVESAGAVLPAADVDCLALAGLHLRPGMSSIKAADDGVNGYITDERVYV